MKRGKFMSFNYSNISDQHSIKIGSDTAPIKVVEYINLRCPDSKFYEEEIAPYLNTFIQEGKVQRIMKHFDKKVYGLESGNLLNQYLNYATPIETYEMIQKLFKEQDEWGFDRLAQIPHIATDYGLTLQPANRETSKAVLEEVEAVGVEMIPTVFVNDTAFVERFSFEDFKKEVDHQIK